MQPTLETQLYGSVKETFQKNQHSKEAQCQAIWEITTSENPIVRNEIDAHINSPIRPNSQDDPNDWRSPFKPELAQQIQAIREMKDTVHEFLIVYQQLEE